MPATTTQSQDTGTATATATIREVAALMGYSTQAVADLARRKHARVIGFTQTATGARARVFDRDELIRLVDTHVTRSRTGVDTVEDAAWLAATGETADRAAARLNIAWPTLARLLHRYGRTDVIQQLTRHSHVRGLDVRGRSLAAQSRGWAA